jgi:DNA-binding transcriptional ArsR family regulator
MRQPSHPAIEDVRPDAILHALGDAERAAIFAQIEGVCSGGTCTALANTGERVVPRSSLSQHIKVLREAGLIRSERHGVEIRNRSRTLELQEPLRDLVRSIMDAYAWHYGPRNRTDRKASSARIVSGPI